MVHRKSNIDDSLDWFTPELYDHEDTMRDWIDEIGRRLLVKELARHAKSSEQVRDSFEHLVLCRDEPFDLQDTHQKVRWPISYLSVFEASYLHYLWEDDPTQKDILNLAKAFAVDTKNAFLEKMDELHDNDVNATNALKEIDYPSLQPDILSWHVPVSVDIRHDDETLKVAFKVWLSDIRSMQENPKSLRRTIEKKDFQHWRKFKILEAFDLQIWKAHGPGKLTDARIGYLLWKDLDPSDTFEFVDTTDRYRRTTKPLVDSVIHWGLHEQLLNQRRLIERIKEIGSKRMPHQSDG